MGFIEYKKYVNKTQTVDYKKHKIVIKYNNAKLNVEVINKRQLSYPNIVGYIDINRAYNNGGDSVIVCKREVSITSIKYAGSKIVGYLYVGDNKYIAITKSTRPLIFIIPPIIAIIGVALFLCIPKLIDNKGIKYETIDKPIHIDSSNISVETEDNAV